MRPATRESAPRRDGGQLLPSMIRGGGVAIILVHAEDARRRPAGPPSGAAQGFCPAGGLFVAFGRITMRARPRPETLGPAWSQHHLQRLSERDVLDVEDDLRDELRVGPAGTLQDEIDRDGGRRARRGQSGVALIAGTRSIRPKPWTETFLLSSSAASCGPVNLGVRNGFSRWNRTAAACWASSRLRNGRPGRGGVVRPGSPGRPSCVAAPGMWRPSCSPRRKSIVVVSGNGGGGRRASFGDGWSGLRLCPQGEPVVVFIGWLLDWLRAHRAALSWVLPRSSACRSWVRPWRSACRGLWRPPARQDSDLPADGVGVALHALARQQRRSA